jgi:hypothetical protein
MLLSLLQGGEAVPGGGYRRLVQLVLRSHEREARRPHHLRTARARLRGLVQAGIVRARRREGEVPPHLEVSPALQRDFSLHHTLALYLLSALEQLDRASPSYALDVLSLVESILENPAPVLYAQLDRLKGERVRELKAQGVEYAERMEELDKLEWPKPLADFIYGTFNAFAAAHPWVGTENIRPKSVARDMLERFASFADYVREYGLQRSEGVLLRYLSEAYRALAQTVPAAARDEAVEEQLAALRTLVRGVDSSLLDEWEGLSAPPGAPAPLPVPGPGPREPEQPRAFAARVRSELHALLRALARKDWEGARASLHDPEGEWTEERLEAEMASFFAEHQGARLTPDARQPAHTLLREEEPRRFRAQQRILDLEGEDDWVIECEVDLRAPRADGQPLIALRRIGT